MIKDLIKDFLNPKTITVIGASKDSKKVGGVLMEKLNSFKGKVVPVNPFHKTILGKKCYASVKNFPEKIDLAIIATPAITIKKILRECAKKKIKNIIIISAGFSEQGNFKLEKEIKEITKKAGIKVLGPNCFGIANPYLDLDATFSNSSAKKGNIAFISQSGALWSFISDVSASSKIGFSGFVSLGNMADLNFNDFIEYFEKDKKTKRIILYIERLENGKEFIELCRKCKKQIIAIKAGSSDKGSKAAISHTGSLATDFKIYEGAFKQAGIKQVNSVEESLNMPPQKPKNIFVDGKKTIILTNAGGAGALLSDYCEKKGLDLIDLREGKKNPIDILGTANSLDYEKAIKEIGKKYKYDLLLIILTPQKMSEPEKTAKSIIQNCNKEKTIVYFLGENSIKKAKEKLGKKGFLCFNQMRNSLEKLEIKDG
ncbi:MAG: CoA-binding protein [archaeon]